MIEAPVLTPAHHRGERVFKFYTKSEDIDWRINDVDCLIAKLKTGYWIVAAWAPDEKFSDDGPYETAEAAATAATFQDEAK